jgi:hypothetical protein
VPPPTCIDNRSALVDVALLPPGNGKKAVVHFKDGTVGDQDKAPLLGQRAARGNAQAAHDLRRLVRNRGSTAAVP